MKLDPITSGGRVTPSGQYFAGTRVVSLVEVRGTNNSLYSPMTALNDLLVRIRMATKA